MTRRKLFFIGVDCLDLYLVLRWHMKGFIVGDYGYHFVGYDLYTPIIWAKILTGVDVTSPPYRFSSKRLSRRKRLVSLYYINNVISKVTKKIKVNKNVTGSSGANVRLIFHKTLVGKKLTLSEQILVKMLRRASMAEQLPAKLRSLTVPFIAATKGLKVFVIEFPPLNDEIYSLIRNMLYFYIDSPPEEKRLFLNYIWKITHESMRLALEHLGSTDVIYWYTPYIDTASHMYYKPGNIRYMLALRKAYHQVEKLVAKAAEEAISSGYEVIVASDHGFNPKLQDHSHYGFWSTTASKNIPRPERAEDLAYHAKKILEI